MRRCLALFLLVLLACSKGGGGPPGALGPAVDAGEGGPAAADAGPLPADAGASADAGSLGDAGGAAADAGGTDAGGTDAGGPDAGAVDAGGADAGLAGWVVEHEETFASLTLPAPSWQPDPVPDDGPFADNGVFFTRQGIHAPAAFRLSAPFGEGGWLTVESYTRDPARAPSSLFSVAPDPAEPAHRVLRIASPAHTDATVIRSSRPLPARYRISMKVGFASFGDGKPGLNGYDGGESAGPWWSNDATPQNGFYWLTILDALPRPHNNTWIHHHRKVVVDSDNNYPAWMEMFDGKDFVTNGEHPVMIIALDGKGAGTECCGKPFLSWSAGAWQPSGKIRAVDSYLPGEWYRVSIERSEGRYTLEISGRFRYGGAQTYRASIDYRQACVWHFNQSAGDDASGCVDNGYYPSVGPAFPNWPAGQVYPDYFMFGDPHENYYQGEVFYDDLKLEVWR